MPDFRSFFREATRNSKGLAFDPDPYQIRLAETPISNRALQVPTGAGKTAAAILSWLYRLTRGHPDAPRRLVYCLPMRALVQQTRDNAAKWISNVRPDVQVAILMGGELDNTWEIHPEKPLILIGTQDMLLSRALNRGYAMKRYRWPVHFGLLNNDCLWVCDEVQLMGDGLVTSTQLAAFRDRLGVIGKCPTLWMSATMTEKSLKSVDLTYPPELFTLAEDDLKLKRLHDRLHAVKRLARAPEQCRFPAGLARFLTAQHKVGTQTIAVVNRVDRARETYDELLRIAPNIPAYLLHSRFRPPEKKGWRILLEHVPPAAGRILIATQVIEAGVDISSTLLVTDLAPWSSVVQRFGRCNRAGEVIEGADIYWVDRPLLNKSMLPESGELTETIATPYSVEDIAQAEVMLRQLKSASPIDLPPYSFEFVPAHVLRRRDLVDLFDTTQDLSGYDLDVSRFIRSEQDRDVLIAWRKDYPPKTKEDAPSRDELCPAPISDITSLLKERKKNKLRFELSAWDALDGVWSNLTDPKKLRPGMMLIANASSGGYDVQRGWNPESVEPVAAVDKQQPTEEEGIDDEPLTFRSYKQTLAAHSLEVHDRMQEIIQTLENSGISLQPFREDLTYAARYHDWGKAHPVFQATVNPEGSPYLLAKSKVRRKHSRKHFRHELASALALWQTNAPDLAAYLVAAHHGKVRLSIRALPGENKPEDADRKFARGVHDGDTLPATQLDGITTAPVSLDLEPMLLGTNESGARSWLDRMLELRDTLGIFRMGYLEAIIVAADCWASENPNEVLA